MARSPELGRGSSREAFVRATGKLLRRQGYAATGLSEIVTESGAPKGSLYFHFPGGKEQLALVAMQDTGERLGSAIAAALGSSDDLGEALGRLLDGVADGLERSGYRDGCPIATVALETAADSDALRTCAGQAFEAWLATIERRLVAAGHEREPAARRAVLVLAAIEGALLLARVRRSPEPLRDVRRELVELLG
jgi:TetR/AcrR family transcriptional regulator, lmrAB and yxaGH operons repressor